MYASEFQSWQTSKVTKAFSRASAAAFSRWTSTTGSPTGTRQPRRGRGFLLSEILGKHVFEVFPNAEGALLGEKYRLAMETRTFQSCETAYKDERFDAWYDVRIYPAETGLSVFFQDITEKKTEQRQKEMLVEISKAINASKHLDELCIRAAEKIALLFEIPSKFVCIYLYRSRAEMRSGSLPRRCWKWSFRRRSSISLSPRTLPGSPRRRHGASV